MTFPFLGAGDCTRTAAKFDRRRRQCRGGPTGSGLVLAARIDEGDVLLAVI